MRDERGGDEDYRRKGLPLDEYGLDADEVRLDVTPESGLYYLMQVRKEADAHPVVTIAPNRDALITKHASKHAPVIINDSTDEHSEQQIDQRFKYFSITDSPTIFSPLPTARYISTFLAEFTTQRNSIRDTQKPYVFLPLHNDRRGWKRFCYGYADTSLADAEMERSVERVVDHGANESVKRDRSAMEDLNLEQSENEHEVEEEKEYEQSEDDLDAMIKATIALSSAPTMSNIIQTRPARSPRIPFQGYLPTLAIVPHLSQKIIAVLISNFSRWLKDSMSEREFDWIMVILLCVTSVMTCDQLSSVRALIKQCRDLREAIWFRQQNAANANAKRVMSSEVVGLGLIIAIGTRLFGQSDLADIYPE